MSQQPFYPTSPMENQEETLLKPSVSFQPGYQPYYPPTSTPYFLPNSMPNYRTFGSQQKIIVVGACPACRVGLLETEYSCLCICCILCCFPFGLGKHRKCNNCGAYFR